MKKLGSMKVLTFIWPKNALEKEKNCDSKPEVCPTQSPLPVGFAN